VDRVQIFLVPTLGGGPVPGGVDAAPRPACGHTLTAVTYERLGDAVLVTGYLPDSALPHQQARQVD